MPVALETTKTKIPSEQELTPVLGRQTMQASALSPSELGQGKTALSSKLGVKIYAIDYEQSIGLKRQHSRTVSDWEV